MVLDDSSLKLVEIISSATFMCLLSRYRLSDASVCFQLPHSPNSLPYNQPYKFSSFSSSQLSFSLFELNNFPLDEEMWLHYMRKFSFACSTSNSSAWAGKEALITLFAATFLQPRFFGLVGCLMTAKCILINHLNLLPLQPPFCQPSHQTIAMEIFKTYPKNKKKIGK